MIRRAQCTPGLVWTQTQPIKLRRGLVMFHVKEMNTLFRNVWLNETTFVLAGNMLQLNASQVLKTSLISDANCVQ